MANKDYSKEIRSLELSYDILPKRPDTLSKSDLKTLGEACTLYLKYYEPYVGSSVDPRVDDAYSFQKFVINTEIERLINKFKEAEEKEKEIKQSEPKEQEASIPPELESLVAEYRQNQALLENEEIKSNSQRSVAEQVKIAIAHSKIKELALANRERRLKNGEKFQKNALAVFGSPKSESDTEALAPSYSVVKQVAFTYGGFSKLPPQLQNEIITSAVKLNTIGVIDIDTAIQASALQIDTSTLDEITKNNLATIPGGFISSVYQEVKSSDEITLQYKEKISANEEKLIELQKQGKIGEAQSLIEENQHLTAFLENQSSRLANSIAKKTESFNDFEKDRGKRLSQDPDLKDRIELANKNNSSRINNLERNGVIPHIYTSMDDARLLEQAIRKDMPGFLLPNAGYEAEYAAALINHPKTQDPNLSPQAILLYGKELTPTLLAKARRFAKANPDSALGKLFKTRKEIFDSAGSQLRKISQSPLGKEISKATTGIGKVFKPVSSFFSKISDKLGRFGGVIGIVTNPWGALRSWAGKKAGQLILRQIIQRVGSETLKKGAEMLLKNGLKESVKKLIAQAAAKAAIKFGVKTATKITLEAAAQAANVVPGLGILIAVAIEVLWWIGEKTIGVAKKIAKSLYGEEVKARDLLAMPVVAIGTAIGGVITFIGSLATATVAAAGSAVGIIALGTFFGFFFYITSIVVAPLISTLVQLESTTRTIAGGGLVGVCPEGGQEITARLAGQMQDGLEQLLPDTVTARSTDGRLCITPTMIVIHWSGGWDNDQGNDATYGTLISRNLACQLASDTNDTILMQPFYETQVELPWCNGAWNIYSIDNELAGGYVSSPTVDIRFTDELGNPHRIGNPYKPSQTVFPETSVVDHAVSAICTIMKQYNIPWTQIYGHYHVPGSGKEDPGKEFLEDYFILRAKNECQ